ncbi:MAG: hypothetical protein ABFD50_20130 [Smithella sp.]
MKVEMEDSGAAKILGEACKKAGIEEASVAFRNNYEKNLVQIWGFCATPEQHGYGTKAMQVICNLSDLLGYNLVLRPDYTNLKVLEKFYPRFGFKYINNKTEFLRNYSKRIYFLQKIKSILH